MPLGESQARGVPLCSARPTSMPRSGRMSKERPLPVLKRKAHTPRAVVEDERFYSRDLLQLSYSP
jgi:hypothetical protein